MNYDLTKRTLKSVVEQIETEGYIDYNYGDVIKRVHYIKINNSYLPDKVIFINRN